MIFIIVFGTVLGAMLLFFLTFLFLIKTNGKRKERMARFASVKYAHRGLHGEGRAENSLSAFRAAVEAGYGIELDVRLSKDGELVVFHDDTLDRVTAESGRVDERDFSELSKIKLSGTEDVIPSFREVLSLVDGKVPLLVEIKEDAFKYGVTEKCAEILKEYKGEFIVESFNPLCLGRFRKLMPEVLIGVLSDNFMRQKKYRKPMYFLLKNLMLNAECRPDFIAYNHEEYRTGALKIAKFFFRPALIAWTVRSLEAEELAKKHGFSGIIFEGYRSPLDEKEN